MAQHNVGYGAGNAGVDFYVFDPTGSPSDRLSNSGAVSDTFDFSAWGVSHYSNGSDQDVLAEFGSQWGSRELAAGLAVDWMGHRLYNPATGRFESRDPIGYDGGMNLYGFAADNPVNYSDPWGTNAFTNWYWNGEGGIGGIVDTYLFNGSVGNLGTVTGEYDSGCVGADQVARAAAGVGVNAALLFLPGGEEGKGIEAGVKLSEKGLGILQDHLAQFGDVPYNNAMVSRLQDLLGSGTRATGADANFYIHEISEARFMGQGLDYDAAHAASLEKYSMSPFSLYHPDVVEAFSNEFSQGWFDYWGLQR